MLVIQFSKKCFLVIKSFSGGEGPAFEDNVLIASVHCNDAVELASQVTGLRPRKEGTKGLE